MFCIKNSSASVCRLDNFPSKENFPAAPKKAFQYATSLAGVFTLEKEPPAMKGEAT